MSIWRKIVPLLVTLMFPGLSVAEELPQGPGLAAGYDADQGIEGNAAVVFAEDFESGSTDFLATRWSEVTSSVISFSSDKPDGSKGKKSLAITASDGSSTGGHLYKLLDQGYDKLFVRFYTKFPPDHGYIHHFVRLRGWTMLNPWPNGNLDKSRNENACGIDIEPIGNIFSTGSLNEPAGIWTLNAFWHQMRSWENEDGTGTIVYPNLFQPEIRQNADRDRWYCVEAMVGLNSSPEAYDGEMALWIDGRLVSHYAPGTPAGYWRRDSYRLDQEAGTPFEGINWRPNEYLQLNRLWLLYYVSESAFAANKAYKEQNPADKVNTSQTKVYFDHVVLAREYIGPLGGEGRWGAVPEGDYNYDGALDISDVVRLAVLQCRQPASMALDYNYDGKVNISDILSLLLHLRFWNS